MASKNYSLRYKTFNQLLDEVRADLVMFDLEGMIEPAQLIKVAKRITYDLGLRIYKTKEAILELDHSRVKLPDDFYIWNYGMLCGDYTVQQVLPQGTHMEERQVYPTYQEIPNTVSSCTTGPVNCNKCTPNPCSCLPCANTCSCGSTPCQCQVIKYDPANPYGDICVKPRVFMNCKNETFELVQILKTETRNYKMMFPLKIKPNPIMVSCDCPNLSWNCPDEVWIQDGFLHSSFRNGKIYINYQGHLEDDDGNLLVPDHDMINEYYEYGLKKRILENLLMAREDVGPQIQMIEAQYRIAKIQALTIVNTPDFAEMKQVHDMNRKAMYGKYYQMFSSTGPYRQDSPVIGNIRTRRY